MCRLEEEQVDGVSRMQCLIKDLLEYSQVDVKGKPIIPTEFEPAQ